MNIFFKYLVFPAVFLLSQADALTVPFDNYKLNANATLSSSYSFGGHGSIFCYTPNMMTQGVITWPYKGVTQSGSLPIVLTNNSNITGQLADNSGLITIHNTLKDPIVVSCDFAL